MLSFMELGEKEIINIATGRRMGYADDVLFDENTQRVEKLVIFGKNHFLGLGGKEEDTVIEWPQIKTIGTDTILVETTAEPRPKDGRKRRYYL